MISLIMLAGLVLGGAYASLLVYASITQFGKSEFPKFSLGLMIICGIIVDLALIILIIGFFWSIILIAIGLVSIQIIAIYNGWYVYKKISIRHQSVRAVLSLCIFVLLILK